MMPLLKQRLTRLSEGANFKEAFADIAMLAHPRFTAPSIMVLDGSDTAVAAIFQQFIDGAWQLVSFFSKQLTPSECLDSTFGRQLLAA